MDVESKIKEDMRSLGCNSEVKISLACFLYMHLVDKKLMYDTEYCYNEDVDTLYVVARRSKSEKMNIYVPIPTFEDVNMDFIGKLQENLCTIETGPSINLAFIDGDSSTVIYTFTKGLVERPTPEKVTERRTREERRIFIDNELRKNKNDIMNNALNGGFVDDDDCQGIRNAASLMGTLPNSSDLGDICKYRFIGLE
ncbi:hypothetical protein MSG28_012895 [Choristoneura fumiferana]|uniref:Uncharacterized protein n=1 Tax=Choristoneura fumiferana TaxID=7141 RepID=A0ACC0JIG1_CHOFU|nr:hypothetical protein MSG28_012895 [Choristoneura fumiferana]